MRDFHGCASGVEGSEDFEGFQFGDEVVDWCVEREFPSFDELQRADGGHEFGAGGYPHHGAGLEGLGPRGGHGGVAEGFGVGEGALVGERG